MESVTLTTGHGGTITATLDELPPEAAALATAHTVVAFRLEGASDERLASTLARLRAAFDAAGFDWPVGRLVTCTLARDRGWVIGDDLALALAIAVVTEQAPLAAIPDGPVGLGLVGEAGTFVGAHGLLGTLDTLTALRTDLARAEAEQGPPGLPDVVLAHHTAGELLDVLDRAILADDDEPACIAELRAAWVAAGS